MFLPGNPVLGHGDDQLEVLRLQELVVLKVVLQRRADRLDRLDKNSVVSNIINNKFGCSTVCPRSSDSFSYGNLLHKMGHYFMDRRYMKANDRILPTCTVLE